MGPVVPRKEHRPGGSGWINGAVLIKKRKSELPALSPPPAKFSSNDVDNKFGCIYHKYKQSRQNKKKREREPPAGFSSSVDNKFCWQNNKQSRQNKNICEREPKPPVKHMCSDNIRWYSDNNDFCELLQYTRERGG